MKAVIIPPDGMAYEKELSGELKDYQQAVGGLVQAIPFCEGCDALINDEGKLKDLPRNHVATNLCLKHKSIYPDDFISGPMVVVGATDDGEWTDIPEEILIDLMIPF